MMFWMGGGERSFWLELVSLWNGRDFWNHVAKRRQAYGIRFSYLLATKIRFISFGGFDMVDIK
jgi:hypothetical protein